MLLPMLCMARKHEQHRELETTANLNSGSERNPTTDRLAES
jgi:hypothetical protein